MPRMRVFVSAAVAAVLVSTPVGPRGATSPVTASTTCSAQICEFDLTSGAQPNYITSGPDGNLWFTEPGIHKVGVMSPDGVLLGEYAAGTTPVGITAGPDGNLWFTDFGAAGAYGQIGRITTSGAVTLFQIPDGIAASIAVAPWGITAGPDGNLWFAEANGTDPGNVNHIGRITRAGTFLSSFAVPTANSSPEGITVGSDGNIWFEEENAPNLGRVVLSGPDAGTLQEFGIGLSNTAIHPTSLTSGSDGNLWFSVGSKVMAMTPSGTIVASTDLPAGIGSGYEIATGPDGAMWLTGFENSNTITRLPLGGAPTVFTIPTASSGAIGITGGPDGNMWFAEHDANKIGRLISPAAQGSVPTVTRVSPSSSSWNGGTDVTIFGTGFNGATEVTFGGGSSAHFNVESDTVIRAVSPASAAGKQVGANIVDVRVTTSAGTSAVNLPGDRFWYRGVAVILIRGLSSKLPVPVADDEFWRPDGLVTALRADGWPAYAMLDYSYNTGSATYTCDDTAFSIADHDLPTLDSQITTYARFHPHTDFYLVGHSQGGLIALSYLTKLRLDGRHASDLVPGMDAHLASIASLDSPDGGINRIEVTMFSPVFRSLCGSMPVGSLQADLGEFAALDESTSGLPFGATASIATAILHASGPVSTNETTVGYAARDEGVRTLTVGNLNDFLYDPWRQGSISLSTQWVADAGADSGVYARVINKNSLSCSALKIIKDRILAIQCYKDNHGLVLTDGSALGAVVDVFDGRTPGTTGGLVLPPF